jgi:hypothetical protein
MEKMIRHIIREELLKSINEQEIETSAFSEDEEKFLSKFIELGTDSLGIIYAPNEMGIREFLGRSGPELNLNMQVFQSLTRDNIISLVPYGGYSRNEDYTIKLNIPLQDLEGITPPADDKKQNTGGEEGEDAANMPATPTESVETSQDLAKKLVLEAKKSKKKKKSKVHTGKSRALKRLPGGYVTYLERIIQILGEKVKNDMEKEHLVADILDNLSHNFGLTPKQVYRSFIYYKSQNRLANIIKERLETDETMIKLKELLKQSTRLNLFEQETEQLPPVEFDDVFNNNYITINDGTWQKHANKVIEQIQNELKKGKRLEDLAVKINGQATDVPATNRWDNKVNKAAPDHDFGGDSEFKGWVTKYLTDDAGKATNDKRAKGSGPDKYQTIAKGNDFLAKERAEALRQKIVPYIQNALKFKMQIDISADKVTDKTTRSAHAVVTSAVTPREELPRYVIQYPWYKVGNQPNMVLVDGDIATGWRQNKPGTMSTKWYQSTLQDKNIVYSGFQKGGKASGLINAYAFIKLNADSYKGSMAIYKDEKSWLADVKKMTIYASALYVGELRFGDLDSKEYLPGYRGAEGYLDKTGSSKYTGFAKFKMRSKDLKVSSGADYYLFKPQGDKAFYIADLFKTRMPKFDSPATGAYDSDGNRSLIIGKKYSVWNGVNITADNLNKKIETGKATKNPDALAYTGKTTIETFS